MKYVNIILSDLEIRACDDARLAALIRESAPGAQMRKRALAEMKRRFAARV